MHRILSWNAYAIAIVITAAFLSDAHAQSAGELAPTAEETADETADETAEEIDLAAPLPEPSDEPAPVEVQEELPEATPARGSPSEHGGVSKQPEPPREAYNKTKLYLLGDAAAVASPGDGRAGAVGSVGVSFVSDMFRPVRGLVRQGTETSTDSSIGSTILLPGPTATAIEASLVAPGLLCNGKVTFGCWGSAPKTVLAPLAVLAAYRTKLEEHNATIVVGRLGPTIVAFMGESENPFMIGIDLSFESRSLMGNVRSADGALEALKLRSWYCGFSVGLMMKIKQIYGDGRFLLIGAPGGPHVPDLTGGQLVVSLGLEADLSFTLSGNQ